MPALALSWAAAAAAARVDHSLEPLLEQFLWSNSLRLLGLAGYMHQVGERHDHLEQRI
jgi:hypothetical protein